LVNLGFVGLVLEDKLLRKLFKEIGEHVNCGAWNTVSSVDFGSMVYYSFCNNFSKNCDKQVNTLGVFVSKEGLAYFRSFIILYYILINMFGRFFIFLQKI
jgi:hypothetical protein